jgi:hypothetical protein
MLCKLVGLMQEPTHWPAAACTYTETHPSARQAEASTVSACTSKLASCHPLCQADSRCKINLMTPKSPSH